MSLRPIEMQGSFPHSQKTGKIQEQLQQRFQTRQELQAQEEEQKMQQLRQSIQKTHQSNFQKIRDEKNDNQDQSNQGDGPQKEKRDKNQPAHKEQHPFKGKFIDYSG